MAIVTQSYDRILAGNVKTELLTDLYSWLIKKNKIKKRAKKEIASFRARIEGKQSDRSYYFIHACFYHSCQNGFKMNIRIFSEVINFVIDLMNLAHG